MKQNTKVAWMTKGIKTSCKRKRELYMSIKNSNNAKKKLHYKSYCRILSKVITAAKKMNHDINIKKISQ
jgi:ribosomal protein L33